MSASRAHKFQEGEKTSALAVGRMDSSSAAYGGKAVDAYRRALGTAASAAAYAVLARSMARELLPDELRAAARLGWGSRERRTLVVRSHAAGGGGGGGGGGGEYEDSNLLFDAARTYLASRLDSRDVRCLGLTVSKAPGGRRRRPRRVEGAPVHRARRLHHRRVRRRRVHVAVRSSRRRHGRRGEEGQGRRPRVPAGAQLRRRRRAHGHGHGQVRAVRDGDGEGDAAEFHSKHGSAPSINHDHFLDRCKVTLSGLLNLIDGLWSATSDERVIVFTTNYKERLLRPGRMDMHVYMGYCGWEAFKTLAHNYFLVDDHPLFPEIRQLLAGVEATPAEVSEMLLRCEDAGVALRGLAELLKEKKKQEARRDGQQQQ
ncbi:hypothetical protein OsI_26206 [Oryza sativa Indica Group]|uniref:AAA+ ATPase At3g28540-like C-terminal domain-containing protein n=1 Tax=Oryza sativa subsp. indica TaxID=39946 RepID=B8B6N3_ORYSI|nr:hypothetical protein OsI_26206 [Oryza sativa Indica Group]